MELKTMDKEIIRRANISLKGFNIKFEKDVISIPYFTAYIDGEEVKFEGQKIKKKGREICIYIIKDKGKYRIESGKTSKGICLAYINFENKSLSWKAPEEV
jgi:hypothetical protein